MVLGKRVLLTGPPGVGKTTALVRVVSLLRERDVPVAGFFTEEVREGGRRVGFDLVPFDGPRRVMARVGLESPHRLGRYGVDVQAVEDVSRAAQRAIEALPEGGVVVLDEVGKMEVYSGAFCTLVESIVAGRRAFILTVAQAGVPLARRILARDDVLVLTLGEGDRDAVPARVASVLGVAPDGTP